MDAFGEVRMSRSSKQADLPSLVNVTSKVMHIHEQDRLWLEHSKGDALQARDRGLSSQRLLLLLLS